MKTGEQAIKYDIYIDPAMQNQAIEIQYTHGNKYTKKWIGYAKRLDTGGGFTLSYLFNGGRFSSEKEILRCVEAMDKDGYNVTKCEKVSEIKH